MNKVLVRCWEIYNYRPGEELPDRLFITYPEGNAGHDLITCLNCGEIYAITLVKKIYVGPPLEIKIRKLKCVSCGNLLDGNIARYPDTYIIEGNKYNYERDLVLPNDSSSIVKEFYGIYE